MKNTTWVAAILFSAGLGVSTARAEVQILNRGDNCRRGGDWIRISYPHVPLSDPNDPFHETYKRNTGRLNDQAAKPVVNTAAKQTAAENRALELEKRRQAMSQGGVKVYSNVKARTESRPTSPAASSGSDRPQNIYISNSNVTIGR